MEDLSKLSGEELLDAYIREFMIGTQMDCPRENSAEYRDLKAELLARLTPSKGQEDQVEAVARIVDPEGMASRDAALDPGNPWPRLGALPAEVANAYAGYALDKARQIIALLSRPDGGIMGVAPSPPGTPEGVTFTDPHEAARSWTDLMSRVSRLEWAVDQAAAWFDEYEALHAAKGSADGDLKARTNAERAAILRASLEGQ